ncbi:hypothetical protein [Ktedonobacter racemifer]|uniref:hypothetical protein n=1 Tax=Ktedonobacter racemifer TaxID=363277 RepID=UPI000590C2EF|nr:hypothetical protein [Ktedonobacter racemifer]
MPGNSHAAFGGGPGEKGCLCSTSPAAYPTAQANMRTGGKQQSGRTRQGNRWAKTVLIQAAHAAGHTRTYLGEQYRRISARRGSKKAAMAVGHSILVIFVSLGQNR